MAWKHQWSVKVDGRDVSDNMRPYLTEIEVQDRDGTASDSCRLVFDDQGGHLLLPAPAAPIEVTLDGVSVFQGVVDSTPWTLTRGDGRILEIVGRGRDTRGATKKGQNWHLDDATLQEALDKAAQAAGLSSVSVDPELAAIRRAYWSPNGSSFGAWASRLAKEHGATFKVSGDRAAFAKRGQGLAVSGEAMPTVTASIPGNVISMRLDPLKGRPRYAAARVRSFDRETASFKTANVDIEPEAEGLTAYERSSLAYDEEEAGTLGKAKKADAERDGAFGEIEMTLEPSARVEGTLIISGARKGIDGTYRIAAVTHRANRSGGAVTSLEVKQPQGAAGKDERGPRRDPSSVPVPTPRPA